MRLFTRLAAPLFAFSALYACATSTASGPRPTGSASARFAPRPFSPQEIRRSWRLGTISRYRIVQRNKPTIISETKVVQHSSEGVTLENSSFDPQGVAVGPARTSSATWTALMEHATFPAARTTIEDVEVKTAAGPFVAWLYTVIPDESGGVLQRFFLQRIDPARPFVMNESWRTRSFFGPSWWLRQRHASMARRSI